MTYRPGFVTERKRPSPWDDCGLCSGAMAADYTTGGACTPTRIQMRNACGISDHAGRSDPTTSAAVHRAMTRLCPDLTAEVFRRMSWPIFLARIREGYGAVLNGMYGRLPSYYRRWDDYRGGHGVFVMADGGGLWWMDPLAPDGWGGETIPASAARSFAAAFPSSIAGILVPPPAGRDNMILAGGLDLHTNHVLPLAKGTRVYRVPEGNEFYTVNAAVRPMFVGNVDSLPGWRAIFVKTSNFQADHEARESIVYVSGGTPVPA